MNPSTLTHLIALLLAGLSLIIPEPIISRMLLLGGLFAFSGAITNTLAIHMLFERVPLLYGSGVIEARFDAFKSALRSMIMEQFFTRAQLEAFFNDEERRIDLEPLLQRSDFSPAFDALSQSVMESRFGGMLSMFGGEKALEGLREPFNEKLKVSLIAITRSEAFKAQMHAQMERSPLIDDVERKLTELIDARLDELTPQSVKMLVTRLIREHLGWLVVWGGVFGGLIGMIGALAGA
ncbi:MAG: DUF445 domain-containing protein [Campylobacterales bacterium]|nr:DUF445 domain-containing protein [Campylobacterales bacterium]